MVQKKITNFKEPKLSTALSSILSQYHTRKDKVSLQFRSKKKILLGESGSPLTSKASK